MTKCKKCGKQITGKGKTGLCNSCVLVIRNKGVLAKANRKYPYNNKCIDCGKDICKYAKRCRSCDQKYRYKTDSALRSKTKKRLKQLLVDNWSNPIFYKKMCKARKKQAKNLVTRAKINKKLCSRGKTSFEIKLHEIIKKLQLPFRFVGDGKVSIHGYCPDFIDEKRKLIIEVFYDYWKIRQYGSVRKYVVKKYSAYKYYGYETLFVNKEMMCDWSQVKLDQLLVNFNNNKYCNNLQYCK